MARPATKGSIREMLDRIITTGSDPVEERPNVVPLSFDQMALNIAGLQSKVVSHETQVDTARANYDEIAEEARKVQALAQVEVDAAEAALAEARRILSEHQTAFLTEGIKRALLGQSLDDIQRKIEAWRAKE